MRLTNDIRDSLVTKLIRHRFDEPAKQLALKQAAFTYKVYRALFSEGEFNLIQDLPSGWLPSVCDIEIKFGGDYQRLAFSPRPLIGDRLDDKEYPMPASMNCRCAKQFPVRDSLTKESIQLTREYDALREEISSVKQQVRAAVYSTSSTDKLLEVWPELEPFLKDYVGVKFSTALAIPVKDLNAALGLP